MDMLRVAVDRGASIDVLEKLIALQERMESNQARRAFDAAIAEAKTELPPINKNREGHNGRKYADMSAIARAVDPVITRYGLSYRFRSSEAAGRITVFCRISHRDGYFEENALSAPIDTGPGRNAIQAIGSTLTYLQRYSLVQALGLAVTDDDVDDDGESHGEIPEGAIKKQGAPPDKNYYRAEYADFIRALFSLDQPRQLLDHLASYDQAMMAWPQMLYDDAIQKLSARLAGASPEYKTLHTEAGKFRSPKLLVDWGGTLKIEGKPYVGVFRKYFGIKLRILRQRDEERVAQLEDRQYADQVVHEEDGPRPATAEDFEQ
jgi:hypothetical protein